MAIGPQLPPHLTKRKRSPEERNHAASDVRSGGSSEKRIKTAEAIPSPGNQASCGSNLAKENPDEIDVDSSDDDDEAGPQPAPAPANLTSKTIGPSLPPDLESGVNPDEIDLDSSEDDGAEGPVALGPAAPSSATRSRMMGPALPPSSIANGASNSDSEDEDGFGPAPPPQSHDSSRAGASVSVFDQPGGLAALGAGTGSTETGPQREAWMLAPPDGADWASKIDPTKLRNRRFASGPRNGGGSKSSGMGAEWTETPEEKRKRLANKVMGVSASEEDRRASDHGRDGERGNNSRKGDEETGKRVLKYNLDQNRGESLVKQHQKAKVAEGQDDEDDPSKRVFDREKDMARGTKISSKQRNELMNRAAVDFGSRFSKGSYL